MSVNWDYYDSEKFDRVNDMYLPDRGEGNNMATQIVVAINKLIYKWYNDGDVFDNTYYLSGWANDLSSYANWLNKYVPESRVILRRISNCKTESNYEDLLKDLADIFLDEEELEEYSEKPNIGSVYDCDGPYEFNWLDEDDEEEYDEDGWV